MSELLACPREKASCPSCQSYLKSHQTIEASFKSPSPLRILDTLWKAKTLRKREAKDQVRRTKGFAPTQKQADRKAEPNRRWEATQKLRVEIKITGNMR